MDDYDHEKVDKTVLALLYLTLHDWNRAWKGFDWAILNRLYEKGWIDDPRNKTKSVALTEEGLALSEQLFEQYFKKRNEQHNEPI
jgi:hypothetical protein